jgi:hypothetical protein
VSLGFIKELRSTAAASRSRSS